MTKMPPRLVLVESDPAIRQPLADYLRECGYRVSEATDSDEAMAILSEPALDVAIVLCDLACAGSRDGFALAHWLREHGRGARMILAGTLSMATERAGELCEEGPVLAKPYDHGLLLDRIKQMVAARERKGR